MAAANLISVKSARRHQALPVAFLDKETLLLAMADPANVVAVDDIQMATGLNCRVAVAPPQDIEALIGKPQHAAEHGLRGDVEEDEDGARRTAAEITDLRASAEDAPVDQARQQHPRPGGHRGRLRHPLRAERGARCGSASASTACSTRRRGCRSGWSPAVVSRIKIMSDLDIAEKRIPQDGRVGVTVEDRRIDLRVTTLPTQRGEGASIRILDEDDGAAHARRARAWTARSAAASRAPSASPTAPCWSPGRPASGKSTTLYAALQELNDVDKNIVTIEDPVEYRLDGRQPDRRPPQGRARPSPPACARSCAPTPT